MTIAKGVNLKSEYHEYTMLVAWHKFDRYDRWLLTQITKLDMNKLPFTPVIQVWDAIRSVEVRQIYAARRSIPTDTPPIPCKEYRRRILYAVMKEHRKHHRKRLRIKT